MDDRGNVGGGGEWSRRRFLLQTAKFSALALLGSPLALAELPVPATPPDPKLSHHSDARRRGDSLGAWATDRCRQCDEAMGF